MSATVGMNLTSILVFKIARLHTWPQKPCFSHVDSKGPVWPTALTHDSPLKRLIKHQESLIWINLLPVNILTYKLWLVRLKLLIILYNYLLGHESRCSEGFYMLHQKKTTKKPNLPQETIWSEKVTPDRRAQKVFKFQLQLEWLLNSNSISYWVHTSCQILRWAVISITLLKSQNGAEEVYPYFTWWENWGLEKCSRWPSFMADEMGTGENSGPHQRWLTRDTQAHLRHRLTQPTCVCENFK